MCDRIKGGAYGRHSELALIACKYNLEIIIFENGTQQWIQRPTGNYQQKHIIALRWCRESVHYDWLKQIKPIEEANHTDDSNEHNRVKSQPKSSKIGQPFTDTDNLSPPPPQDLNRSRQPTNKFSRCLNFSADEEIDYIATSAKRN